jgi:uncharacterized membrane protein
MVKNVLQGRFMNHPLHPLVVHLPVGLWVASLACDIIYKINGNASLAVTSFYCLFFGGIGALLAIPPGLAEYVDLPRGGQPRRIATKHFILNAVILVAVVINLALRYRLQGGVPGFVTDGQLALSIASVLALGYSGYLGGQLVYRHGLGARGHPRERGDRSHLRRVA